MKIPGQKQTLENFSHRIPEGDEMLRVVCSDCGFIHYENPKMIAGSVVTYGDQFLLCKRAIHPQKGRWTLPAGFMELGETPAEGAAREAMEEAHAEIEVKELLGIYTVKRISQVQMFFRAELKNPDFKPGLESTDVKLYDWDDIPWDELAFPSVVWALEDYQKVKGQTVFTPFTNPAGYEDV